MIMENKQLTAVEWLVEQLTYKSKGKIFNSLQKNVDLTEFVEQAKQMEKEQLNIARLECINLKDKGYGK